jgi:hypothetical protein
MRTKAQARAGAQELVSSHQLGNCAFVPQVPPATIRDSSSYLANRNWRQSVDVSNDIDDSGSLRRERLGERRGKRRGFFDANAERAHVQRDAGKIDFAEGPQFTRLLGLLAAIDTIEAAL